ncbi:MAG: hypothetical protein R3D55_22930 [Chloroflexota bacterium]
MMMNEQRNGRFFNPTWPNIRFFLLVLAVFLFVAGCQENEADDTPTAPAATAVPETAVPPTAPSAAAEAQSEIAGEIAITAPATVNVTALAATELAAAGLDSLPDNVSLVTDVYLVESGDTAVAGQIALNIPADADPGLLDLYGWDGTAWVFIPSEYDSATGQRLAADTPLFLAVALGQPQAPNPSTVGGVWNPEAEAGALTEAIVSTLQLDADGQLQGSPTAPPDGAAQPYLQLSNVSQTADTEALAALLADEAAQAAQIEAILELVAPFAGVNLNYQGVDAGQKAAFTHFVQTVAEALAAEEKALVLTLPAPATTEAGYDWAALGALADTVYLQLPLEPQAYVADGAADELLNLATNQIDRRKLVALIPTGSVVRTADAWAPLSTEALLAYFGDVSLVAETAVYEPETAVAAALSGTLSTIEWDATSATYFAPVAEEQDVWLMHPLTAAFRGETAVRHNLQGVAFTTPVQLTAPAEAAAPAIVWTVLDEAEAVVATASGLDPAFTWDGSPDAGEFSLQAAFISGEIAAPLGTVPITIAAAEEAILAEAAADTVTTTGILNRNGNIRLGPGESFAKYPAPLLQNTEVTIVGRDQFGYWLQILFATPDGEQTGWMATSLIDVDPAFDLATLADKTDALVELPDAPVAAAPGTAPVAAATPTPAPTTSSGPPPPVAAPPVAVGSFELGGQTHTFSNPVLMASAGMTWVKFQHKWGEGGNPNDLAGRINNAHAAGFKVLLSIPGANTYPEGINFGEYIQFLAGVAALGPDAIEVWNEMNIDFEWPAGQIDPASYVNNMLAPAYNAIKAANPNVMVISGAPAPTGFDNGTNAWADNRYMAGMLAAGAASYADCIGAHFNAGASSPSGVSGHPTGSAHYSWYLLPTLNVYAQLGKPVCFTELGYLSGEDYGGVPDRFGWAAGTTVAQHAAWLAEAVSVAANTGRVRLIIIFNVDFTQWGDDPQAGYAMIRKNGGCPACETLARVMGR